MTEPLFIHPVLQEKMWGGTKLRDIYGYTIPSDHTGECWAISAHPDGMGTIADGQYIGMSLADLYKEQPHLFGNPTSSVFPLLTKIIDADSALSVQVHPDDAFALEHEGELGKTECWYILDACEDAEIIYGHHAQTKEEFSQMVENGEWDQLLRHVKVKKGDFFFVPSGTIHAIGAGITILETQQSSNTTYRVYDFDRTDQNGNKRDLHIEQSIAVATIPHQDAENHFEVIKKGDSTFTSLIDSDYFSVAKFDIQGQADFQKTAPYVLVSVLDGKATLSVGNKDYPISKGKHFIIPATVDSWLITGEVELIASTPGAKSK